MNHYICSYILLIICIPCILSLKYDRSVLNKYKSNIISTLIGFTLLPISYVNAASNDIDGSKFINSLNELVKLDESWDITVKGNGDNIRRKLGTVYTPPLCTSPLCGITTFIPKYVQAHYDDLDVLAFEEPSNEFLQAYNQADFLAYSSMFADYGNGGSGSGVDYIDSSHEQIKKAIVSLKEVVNVIK